MAICYSCMSQLQADAQVCPHCKSKVPYIPLHREDLRPGTRLNDGRFIVGRALGHGGYGITYIAYDTKMLVKRTIKEYFPKGAVRNDQLVPVYPETEEANVARTREHFLHEARMMIRASEGHIPGIVQGIDTFKENGTSYILMEYLEGCTLDDYMHQVLYGPFQWDAAVRYVVEALTALQKLHEKNIIHRDISCNNIFLCTDNTIRLIDFGSAEPLDKAQTDPGSLWRSRKPAYTPREQAENRKQGTYSDVYAMAVVLFKMITGNVDRNLNGKTLPSVRAAANKQDIPQALDHILMEATAEDPEKRIQTAEEFRKKLLPLIGGEPKSHKGLLITIVATLVVLLGVALAVILTGGTDDKEDAWADITLEAAEESVSYGQVAEFSGTAQAGEEVRLILQPPGSADPVELEPVKADSNGQWNISYDTSELNAKVNENSRIKFTCQVNYSDEEHKKLSNEINLEVDRTLAPLTIGVQDWNGMSLDMTAGDKFTLTGSGQGDRTVIVNAALDDRSGTNVASWEASWDGDRWVCEIDSGELKPVSGVLKRDLVLTAYYDGFQRDTQTEDKVKLTVRRVLQDMRIAFAGELESMTVTNEETQVAVHGTAEPNETIVLHVGEKETVRIPAEENNGTWETTLKAVKDIYGYEFGAKVDMRVYATYDIDSRSASNDITLVSNVMPDKADVYPKIASWPSQVTEGETITLSGTAEPGAVLNLRILNNGTGDNLAEGMTAQADEETGVWEKVLATDQIAEERKEGSTVRYAVSVYQAKETKELPSNTVSMNIFRPVVYETPTIRFADGEGTERTLTYAEALALTGTAKAGEHMRLLVNGNAMQADITAGDGGVWNYSFPNMNNWKPQLDGKNELTLHIQYTNTDMMDEQPLTVTVTNPQYAPLGIAFESGQAETLIGPRGSVVLAVHGEAGREIELLRNKVVWQKGPLDGEGNYTVTMSADDIPYGSTKAVLQARYTQQAENLSPEVALQADTTAEPITVNGEITEETSEISGTAEKNSTVSLTVDGNPVGSPQNAGEEGTFLFTGLQLSAGSAVVITEEDPFGNTTTWNTAAREVPRANIKLNGHANNEYITYGPNNNVLELSGTAAKNKTIQVSLNYPGAAAEPIRTAAGDDEQWSATVQLPVEDRLSATVVIQYEDGKGGNILLYTLCDSSIAAPEIKPDEIYQRTPDAVTCTLGEANCRLKWTLAGADGSVKQEQTIDNIEGTQVSIPLPAERAAGDVLTVTITDAYGNTASASATVLEMRDEVSGMISYVCYGADQKDLNDGGTFTGSLYIEAYVAAGSDANPGTPSVRLVQNGNTISSNNLVQADGDQLARITNIYLPGRQADQGWMIKNGELLSTGLVPGAVELRLVAGNDTLASWNLVYDEDQGPKISTHYVDEDDGYDAGMDVPGDSFHPRSIHITGWLYKFYGEDTKKSIKSGALTLYDDAACTAKVMEINSKKIEKCTRQPNTTQCGDTPYSLDASAYQGAGWAITFTANKLPSGTYWATLDAGGMTFGPFKLTIDNDIKQIKLKDYTDSLSWWEE